MTSTILSDLLSTETSISSRPPGPAIPPTRLQTMSTSSTSPTPGAPVGTTLPLTTLASVLAEPALPPSPPPSHRPHALHLHSQTSISHANSANATVLSPQNTSLSSADSSVPSATCAAPLLLTVQIPPLHHPPPPPTITITMPPPLSPSTPPSLSESSPSQIQTTQNHPPPPLPLCLQKTTAYPPFHFLNVLIHTYLMQTPPCPLSPSWQTHPLPVLASNPT